MHHYMLFEVSLIGLNLFSPFALELPVLSSTLEQVFEGSAGNLFVSETWIHFLFQSLMLTRLHTAIQEQQLRMNSWVEQLEMDYNRLLRYLIPSDQNLSYSFVCCYFHHDLMMSYLQGPPYHAKKFVICVESLGL